MKIFAVIVLSLLIVNISAGGYGCYYKWCYGGKKLNHDTCECECKEKCHENQVQDHYCKCKCKEECPEPKV